MKPIRQRQRSNPEGLVGTGVLQIKQCVGSVMRYIYDYTSQKVVLRTGITQMTRLWHFRNLNMIYMPLGFKVTIWALVNVQELWEKINIWDPGGFTVAYLATKILRRVRT